MMTSNSSTDNYFNALARIRGNIPSYAQAERQVAEWILRDPSAAVKMSMAEVAGECGVSDTTVLRFCRTAGFKGYTDLKLSLVRDMAHPTQIIHDAIDELDDPVTVARKVFASNIQVLRDTLEMLDTAAFSKAVEMLCSTHRILIIGVGTSEPLVQDMYNKFFRLGLAVWAERDAYLQLMKVALFRKGDLVVGISQSGSSVDPVLILEKAKQKGADTICITGNARSPITRYADVTLLSVSQETRAETISSRIAQQSLIDALYVAVSLSLIETANQNEKLIWDLAIERTI
jgi:DNA-binding MurR/RpiR family transcriptional regulator